MEDKDKELLLKDLCARLPYRVKVTDVIDGRIVGFPYTLSLHIKVDYAKIRPYLRPMSSMTEEEESEYHGLCYPEWNNGGLDGGNWHYHNTISSIDWLNAHHFDYRCLIDRGLALEAPKDMYKEE